LAINNFGRTEIGLYSDEELGLWTLGIGVMWAIFQESGNSPIVMHLLNTLDNQQLNQALLVLKT